MKKLMSQFLIMSVLMTSLAQANGAMTASVTTPEDAFLAQVYTIEGQGLSSSQTQQAVQDAVVNYQLALHSEGLTSEQMPERLEAALVKMNAMEPAAAHEMIRQVVASVQQTQASGAITQEELMRIANLSPEGAQFSACNGRLVGLTFFALLGGFIAVFTANNAEPQAGIGAGVFVASGLGLWFELSRCK